MAWPRGEVKRRDVSPRDSHGKVNDDGSDVGHPPLRPLQPRQFGSERELRYGGRGAGSLRIPSLAQLLHSTFLLTILIAIVLLITFLSTTRAVSSFRKLYTSKEKTWTTNRPFPATTLEERTARETVDQLFGDQSQTLQRATSRYTLNNNRGTPKHYDQFYAFAKENGCLIDDYAQVYRDFEAFNQIAKTDKNYFRSMVDTIAKGREEMNVNVFQLSEGKVYPMVQSPITFFKSWKHLLGRLSSMLPSMVVAFNTLETPRVAFNVRRPTARSLIASSDQSPLRNNFVDARSFFEGSSTNEGRCSVANSKKGFGYLVNQLHGFLMDTSTAQLSLDYYPLMSMCKVDDCFGDILVPYRPYRSAGSTFSSRYILQDESAWKDKESMLYWRGTTSGGLIQNNTDYHELPRFRLVKKAADHDRIDAEFTEFANNCRGCNKTKIEGQYTFGTREDQDLPCDFKYILALDGQSHESELVRMLSSNSLVFRSTIFTEYFSSWIKPFEHYVPVLPDLSDLDDKLQWALDHDDEARQIAANAKEFATRVLTENQSNCYYHAVLLEWGRLYNGNPSTL